MPKRCSLCTRLASAAHSGDWGLTLELLQEAVQSAPQSHRPQQLALLLYDCVAESQDAELLTLLVTSDLDQDLPEWSAVCHYLLQVLVMEGSEALLEAFLANCSSLNARDDCCPVLLPDPLREPFSKDGYPPLLIAVEQDNARIIRILLEHGFDPNACTSSGRYAGWTPLHAAAEWGDCAVISMLLNHGASTRRQTVDGDTPLHIAVQNGHSAACQMLLSAEADPNTGNNEASTPLHVAAEEGHLAIIQLLLCHGADIHARNTSGSTALHRAAFFDESAARFASSELDTQVAVVKLLLAHGADMALRDANGLSVLELAKETNSDVIVELLGSPLHGRKRIK